MLKIDKDCHIDSDLEKEYVRSMITILAQHHVKVRWIKATRTHHGRHYYVEISRPVGALMANRLQYLLGDDSKRVAYNEARIKSGLDEWNKLFEKSLARLTTIYSNQQSRGQTT